MIKEGKFGVHEMVCLVVVAMSSKVLFSSVSGFMQLTATSAWLMALISCASAAVLFIFVYRLLKRFPGSNIVQIYDISLGRTVGFAFSITLAGAILFCCAMLFREFAAICQEYVFPNTPVSYINIALLLPCALGAYLGIESIARFTKLAAYFLLASFLLMIAMVSPQIRMENMFPAFGYGFDVAALEGLKRTCTYSEVIFIAILAGSMQGASHIKKSAYYSLLISGIIISAGVLVSVLVLTYTVGQEQISALYTVSRQVYIGDFLQRLDPLFIIMWFDASIITVAVEFYCGLSVYCKAFRLQNHRPAVLPAAVLVFAISFIPKDFTAVEEALVFIRTYGIFVVFLMPMIALAVSALRKKKGAGA